MFQHRIIDLICTAINCFITAYPAYAGSIFCMHPTLQYISGAISTAGWTAIMWFFDPFFTIPDSFLHVDHKAFFNWHAAYNNTAVHGSLGALYRKVQRRENTT
ncbi:hypothetical protein L596_020789 [Steinernema carpocapsae]|uniref:7TM GPCR serpentine receptor class x (Srx) domain-containing protein n=1 Tax=Steinernema carpocapsae TaxID=34508 RepID=A0A4U5MUS6_STECR|nr:hypothetical protein L596_020789 [Steinernema carpocapsae]